MKVLERITEDILQPVRSIEWVVSFFAFIGSIYTFTPLYSEGIEHAGLSPVAQALASPTLFTIYSIILLIGAILIALGLIKHKTKWRANGLFIIAMIRIFQVISTLFVLGALPLTPWLYPLTLAVITMLLWLYEKMRQR